MKARPIGTESLLLGVAEHDPLASRHRVRLIDLADRDFVEYRPDSSLRASIDQACQAAGLQRRVACEVDTIADLVELVALGLGVSLLPPAAIRMAGGRAIGLATDPSIPRDLMLVTPLEREPSPAGQRIPRPARFRTAKQHLSEHPRGRLGGTVRMVGFDDLDLDAVRAELQARRDRDRQRLGVLAERPELGSAVSFGKRIGDGTSEAVSRLTDIGVGEVLERGLDRTERALAKLDEGTYGICDVCGGPISLGRLEALPDSVLCLDCSASERRLPTSASSLKVGSAAPGVRETATMIWPSASRC